VRELFTSITTHQLVVFVVFASATLVQLFYYLVLYIRVPFWKRREINPNHEPISVIICARNEFENLGKHLPSILTQDFPEFEVVVVNHCSEDDTEMLLAEMKLKYKNLKSTFIAPNQKFGQGKKLALTIGMKAATYNRLVFTDADCFPVSDQWLMEMSKSYTPNKQVVLGYGGFLKEKSIVNTFIQFDTLFIAMQYLGFALAGRPYMGVGRNLSYLKTLFFSGKGFSGHYSILSGDDDLFINENAIKANTAVCISKESITRSIPQPNFEQWAKQKKRHLTTATYYKTSDKLLIGFENSSRFLFYVGFVYLLFLNWQPLLILGIFSFRLLTQLVIIKLTMNKFNEKGFWLLTPLFDIILPIIHIIFIISNKLNYRKNKWK